MNKAIPAEDLRSNAGTWAVPVCCLPAVTHHMLESLLQEVFDPDFKGQYLETTYFDTRDFDLRKARERSAQYVTLRVRCYHPTSSAGGNYPAGVYALSVKTEDQKFRVEVNPAQAELYLDSGLTQMSLAGILPSDLFGRLLGLADEQTLVPVVSVCFTRYAVEDTANRLTLDVDVKTDTGKCLPVSVLEFKSTDQNAMLPLPVSLRPIKISKFLWATQC